MLISRVLRSTVLDPEGICCALPGSMVFSRTGGRKESEGWSRVRQDYVPCIV